MIREGGLIPENVLGRVSGGEKDFPHVRRVEWMWGLIERKHWICENLDMRIEQIDYLLKSHINNHLSLPHSSTKSLT